MKKFLFYLLDNSPALVTAMGLGVLLGLQLFQSFENRYVSTRTFNCSVDSHGRSQCIQDYTPWADCSIVNQSADLIACGRTLDEGIAKLESKYYRKKLSGYPLGNYPVVSIQSPCGGVK